MLTGLHIAHNYLCIPAGELSSMAETVWLTKREVFTEWSFTAKFCQPCYAESYYTCCTVKFFHLTLFF